MWARRLPSVPSVAVAALLLSTTFLGALVVAAPEGSATPAAALTSDSWSYGVEKWFNLSIPMPNAVHTIHAYTAWYTVIDRTNLPSAVTQLSLERTVLSNFTAQYCAPDCMSPELQVNLSHATYEHALGFVNLSSAGVVYENGTAVPAFAVLNASATANAVAVSSSEIWIGTPQGVKHVTEEFSAAGQANVRLAFDPALGLAPQSLGFGDTWNATSTYVGAGNWSVAWSYEKTNASGQTTTLSGLPAGSLNATGVVAVDGAVVGSMTLPGGVVLPAITLSFSSDLEVLDGMVFLSRGANFFDGGGHAWDGYRMGFAMMETHRLAVQFLGDASSFRLLAATSFYGTSDMTPAMGAAMRAGSMPMTPATVNATPGVPTVEVTAVPLAPASAAAAASCLNATQNLCPAQGSTSVAPDATSWVYYLTIGIVATGAAVAVASMYLVSRRLR